jgi:mannose-6-phosphate isomerase-like protein (cupin superfamily)
MDRSEFEAEIARDGYDMREAAVTPNERRDMHTHEFDARLFILDGVFILASPETEVSFQAGETCFVPAGTVHAEYGGPEGARYLAARRAVG